MTTFTLQHILKEGHAENTTHTCLINRHYVMTALSGSNPWTRSLSVVVLGSMMAAPWRDGESNTKVGEKLMSSFGIFFQVF